jgi:hypothetical protein
MGRLRPPGSIAVRCKDTLLTPLCQSDHIGRALMVRPMVTSSLVTGRALEKARFFSGFAKCDSFAESR